MSSVSPSPESLPQYSGAAPLRATSVYLRRSRAFGYAPLLQAHSTHRWRLQGGHAHQHASMQPY